jgi:hypothetical protein
MDRVPACAVDGVLFVLFMLFPFPLLLRALPETFPEGTEHSTGDFCGNRFCATVLRLVSIASAGVYPPLGSATIVNHG